MPRIIFLQLVTSAHALSLSRLQHALDRLDRNLSVDACLDVIRHVPGAAPVDKTQLRALAEEDDATLTTHRLDTPDSSTFSSKWSTAACA